MLVREKELEIALEMSCVMRKLLVLVFAYIITVKFLNFRTREDFAVKNLKFKKRGKTFGYFVKKMQME